MILKTSIGSTGVGVMFVESAKALVSIVQLLYRENRYIDILLQEFIKTDYDVRVIVLKDRVMGAMKRPIVEGDFRSNVSQGSEPEIHELTDLENDAFHYMYSLCSEHKCNERQALKYKMLQDEET